MTASFPRTGDTIVDRALYELAGKIDDSTPPTAHAASHAPGGSDELSRPYARVTHSAAQPLAHSTFTTLAFDTERQDPFGMHDPVLDNSRLTVAHDGFYILGAQVVFASNTTGARIALLRVNGGGYVGRFSYIPSVGGHQHTVSATTATFLAAGDFVEAQVWQNSGGALDVQVASGYSPELWIALLTP